MVSQILLLTLLICEIKNTLLLQTIEIVVYYDLYAPNGLFSTVRS